VLEPIAQKAFRRYVWRLAAKFRQSEPTGQHLIDRYRWYYKIPDGVRITEGMIQEHWRTERNLARELLNAPPADRWQTFERCYTELYSRFSWINQPRNEKSDLFTYQRRRAFAHLVGSSPKDIYEVGSGAGELIAYLASFGHQCKATEITRERGQKHLANETKVTWGVSDGVHLDQFERPDSYDVVISDQVIEHLHPDDLLAHLNGVRTILRPNGRYIFATPHYWYGPWDISSVFRCSRPVGVHLKEYGYRNLKNAVQSAGFRDVAAVFRLQATRPAAPAHDPKISRAYLFYLCLVEWVLPMTKLVSKLSRESATEFARLVHLSPDVFIVARK
jgi:SAM-dependent methyltransferase